MKRKESEWRKEKRIIKKNINTDKKRRKERNNESYQGKKKSNEERNNRRKEKKERYEVSENDLKKREYTPGIRPI